MLVVPGRVEDSAALWWVMADGDLPSISVLPPADLTVHDLFQANSGDTGPGPWLVTATGLAADTEYTLTVGKEASSTHTLPSALTRGTPFSVALGSCFYHGKRASGELFAGLGLHRAPDPVRL